MQSESDDDEVAVASSEEDSPMSTRGAIGKLRLPRSLLEKWVEEPFFETAVVGCFVRLGVGAYSVTRLIYAKSYTLCDRQGTRFASWASIQGNSYSVSQGL